MVTTQQAIQETAALIGRGRWSEAEELCRTVLQSDARDFHALTLAGVIAAQTRRTQEAADFFERALAVQPDDAGAAANYCKALTELKRFDESLIVCERLLKQNPRHADGHNLRGLLLQKLERPEAALASFDRAVELSPELAQTHYNRGVVLRALDRASDALASYEQALALRPAYAAAHNNRAVLLQEVGRSAEAIASYDRALAIQPNDAEIHRNRGSMLEALGRHQDALESYERALAARPDDSEAYGARGRVLRELKRFDESLMSYRQALAIEPDYSEVHNNVGIVLQDLMRPDEALQCFKRASELRPNDAEVYVNRGNALVRLGRWQEALECYGRARAINPDLDWLHGEWLHSRMRLCDWRDLELELGPLIQKVAQGKKAVLPFRVLALTDSSALHLQAARIWANHGTGPAVSAPAPHAPGPAGKIRLGYYSADFHDHATAYLAAGLFEQHDRSRFELTGFSYGPPREDDMRRRLTQAFERFVDVRLRSDSEVAQLSRELKIDIAVDLKGYTADGRVGIFAYRAAPVQVSYLGYPGTLGAPFIDYLVADATLIPLEARANYTEKIAYLPHSYQANDRKRFVAERSFAREELGLPRDGFVFCCFNNAYKIGPAVFDAWMRILKGMEGSVLWLLLDTEQAAENVRREAEARGVSGARMVFAPHMKLSEHLARHRNADLFLDTYPYNAHTAASDALWAGLPVLTRSGGSFASRVAGSLLAAAGVPELMTSTPQAYESLAIELATDPTRLAKLAERLRRTRLEVPLFDTGLLARHLEEAYQQMYQRSTRGLSPEHIHIAAALSGRPS